MPLISIAERLRPFSHQAGSSCLIPNSPVVVRAWPARLQLEELRDGSLITESFLPPTGRVDNFTLLQDLEKGEVRLFGTGAQGAFETRFSASPGELLLRSFCCGKLVAENSFVIPTWKDIEPVTERLSLGNHKKPDWAQVEKRASLVEMLPIWMRLGQVTPVEGVCEGPLVALLEQAEEAERASVAQKLVDLFTAGYEGILVPRSWDRSYSGLVEHGPCESSPLPLLARAATLIRSLFIREEAGKLFLLPHLPTKLVCGRFVDGSFSLGRTSFIWSRRELRRVELHAESTGAVALSLPSQIRRCRLQVAGEVQPWQAGDELFLEKGVSYLLDKFER